MALEKKNLALFDFDNTLSICDSFIPFTLFAGGSSKFLRASFNLALRRLNGPVSRKEAKEIMASYLIGGLSIIDIQNLSEKFARIFLSIGLNSRLVEKLREHQLLGDRVIIISASPRLCLESIAYKLGVELIATEMELVDGIITGKVDKENCRGQEKVRRLTELLSIGDYNKITAYGDSDGDKEMLDIATNQVYRGGRDNYYLVRKISRSVMLYCRCLYG